MVRVLIFYHLSSDDTVNFLRPRRRRAANTRRPFGVDMRSRKPCLLRRLRCDGWNVLFISRYFYISKNWECKGSVFDFKCKIFLKRFGDSHFELVEKSISLCISPAWSRRMSPLSMRIWAIDVRIPFSSCALTSLWRSPLQGLLP